MGKLEAAALVLYAATVLLCTILVVGFGDTEWLGALIALTLPWSLVTIVFIWLIHGASLWLFWLVYLGGGAANVYLFHRYLPKLYARLRR